MNNRPNLWQDWAVSYRTLGTRQGALAFAREEQAPVSWWVGALLKFAATLLSLRLAIRYSIRGRAACQKSFAICSPHLCRISHGFRGVLPERKPVTPLESILK